MPDSCRLLLIATFGAWLALFLVVTRLPWGQWTPNWSPAEGANGKAGERYATAVCDPHRAGPRPSVLQPMGVGNRPSYSRTPVSVTVHARSDHSNQP